MQAEVAGTAQTELQQRTLLMEARAVELERLQDGLQNELKDRTAELREEVRCLCYMLHRVTRHSFNIGRDHIRPVVEQHVILPDVCQLTCTAQSLM